MPVDWWVRLRSHPDLPICHDCLGGLNYLHVQEADRTAEEWRRAGIDMEGPRNARYGKREGSISDPDGNVIRFGSPIR
jgi:hypothetical protein